MGLILQAGGQSVCSFRCFRDNLFVKGDRVTERGSPITRYYHIEVSCISSQIERKVDSRFGKPCQSCLLLISGMHVAAKLQSYFLCHHAL